MEVRSIPPFVHLEPSPAGGRGQGDGGQRDEPLVRTTALHRGNATLTPTLSRYREREFRRVRQAI